jgi:hypothetical protein
LQYVHVRFGIKKDLHAKIQIILQKYQKANPDVGSIKQLAKKLCQKDFFLDKENTNPVAPCVVANKIFLGNKYYATADSYGDEDKLLMCMACYYIRNASYPKEFEVFLTLIQVRVLYDLANIKPNGVDNVLALF